MMSESKLTQVRELIHYKLFNGIPDRIQLFVLHLRLNVIN
jgi:hypothetical protein